MSRELASKLTESGYFSIIARPERYADVDAYLDSGRAKFAVMIPLDFSRDIVEEQAPAARSYCGRQRCEHRVYCHCLYLSITEQYSQAFSGRPRAAGLVECQKPGMVQPGAQIEELHHSRADRRYYGRAGLASYVAHCCAGMGAGHDGAA